MTAKIPKIVVYNKKSAKSPGNGEAGRIACVGAFNTTETKPTLFTSLAEAQASFGDDSNFNGCDCLPHLFASGATSVLAVNVTTWSDDDTPVPTKDVTAQNLAAALAKIKGEDWDILFVATATTAALLPVMTAYLDSCFEIKYPAGFVGALTAASDADNIALAAAAGDHCYGVITQALTVNGKSLSVLKSAAYYAGLLAGMNVGNTMTMKTVPYVTAVSPELSFETGGAGKSLLEAGITTFKCQDRNGSRFVVVNSEQPNGLDLYVNRVRDYVVKALALHDFLGERNNETTLNEIKQEVSRVRNECVDVLKLLKDIEFTVEKVSSDCVEIHVTKLLFDGIITEIDVYVTVEVE